MAGRRAGWRLRGAALLSAAFAAAAALATASGAPPPVGPAATSAPFAIGIAGAGDALTGLNGTWTGTGTISYRFQWFRCNAAGAECASIRGATTPRYRLGARDVGKTVGLTVYATDSTGTAAAFAPLVGPIAPARPLLVSTLQPEVTGIPAVGHSLSVTTGTWSPLAPSYSYTWERCNANGRACAPIAGATSRGHRVVAADLGHALVCRVQATDGGTLQDTFSTSSGPIAAASANGPVVVAPPAITGSAAPGSKLIAAPGHWQAAGPLGFTFGWYRCTTLGTQCNRVRSVTGATYTLGADDAGQTIGLTVHATDLTGTTVAYASLVGPVPTQTALTATAAPTLSGSAQTGATLTVSSGLWSTVPSAYSYSWLLCDADGRRCSSIPGATGASYTPTAAESGHTIVAEVKATAGSASQAALSAASDPIG